MFGYCHSESLLGVDFESDLLTSFFDDIQDVIKFSSDVAMRTVSSAYLRLLIFLPPTLMPGISSMFLMMYSVYMQGEQVR